MIDAAAAEVIDAVRKHKTAITKVFHETSASDAFGDAKLDGVKVLIAKQVQNQFGYKHHFVVPYYWSALRAMSLSGTTALSPMRSASRRSMA